MFHASPFSEHVPSYGGLVLTKGSRLRIKSSVYLLGDAHAEVFEGYGHYACRIRFNRNTRTMGVRPPELLGAQSLLERFERFQSVMQKLNPHHTWVLDLLFGELLQPLVIDVATCNGRDLLQGDPGSRCLGQKFLSPSE